MPRICIALDNLHFNINQDYIQGIWDYMLRNNQNWDLGLHPIDFYQSFGFTQDKIADIDGVIGYFRDGPIVDALRRHRVHVVNLTYPGDAVPFPIVAFDSEAIGTLAADYLASNAQRRMVYIGPDGPVCRIRREAFARRVLAVTKRDATIAIFGQNQIHRVDDLLDAAIFDHLRAGGDGVAVFAFSDSYAFSLAQTVIRRGYTIPRDVAILGCGNDERICEFSPVSISSMPLNGRQVGFQAAKAMHELLAGKGQPRATWIEPFPVIERASTSPFATSDSVVANAIGLIRQNITHGMNVSELADQMSLSYRQLEKRFQAALGVSPKIIINRMRIEKCKQLLAQDAMTNAQIARSCGFSNANVFEQAFKKMTGKQPKHFRGQSPRLSAARCQE